MPDPELIPEILTQRLCSEIQLFDLCDLGSCTHRNGRFCTDTALLGRFEKIAEKELRISEGCLSEDVDDTESDDCYGEDGDESDMDYSDESEPDLWEGEE